MISKLGAESDARSHVLESYRMLTDVIGPRLTGTPGFKRSVDWTRDRLTDPSHSHNAHAAPSDGGAEELGWCPPGPLPATNQSVSFDNPPRGRQQQRPGEVGGRVGEHIWGIGDHDAPPLSRIQINVIVADGIVSQDFQLAR
jgi:hypothetical protein